MTNLSIQERDSLELFCPRCYIPVIDTVEVRQITLYNCKGCDKSYNLPALFTKEEVQERHIG